MTRKPKRHRMPQPCDPARSERTASGAVDRLGSGSAPQVQRPYTLLAICGFLALAVIAVFGQTARHGFVDFDDNAYVYENRHVMEGLTGEGAAWAITAYHAGNWHPLTWLSHMLDCQLYGLKPGGHHLTNVLLHAAAAILLLLALLRMTGAIWPSAWVAAIFAIHPLRVESVAWVAERKDVLSGICFMLTLWLYSRYTERPASWGRYLSVVASFALGLTAKPMLVTLPFVLLLLDYWPLGRVGPPRENTPENEANRLRPDRRFMRLVVEKIPLFVLAAASCIVTLTAQRVAMQSLEQLDFAERIANAVVTYVAYIGKMLYPAGLAVLYPLPKGPLPAWEVVASVALLLTISAAAFLARRKCPYLLFGWLWYLGMLVPVAGLVQVGNQAMADRYTYLAQIGLTAAIAWGPAHLAGSRPSRHWAFTVVAAPVLAGLMVCAWHQTQCWCDSETLWTRALACTSQNSVAHNNLGNEFVLRGEIDAAIAHFHRALEIQPDYVEPFNNLGNAFAFRGETDKAIAHYRKALEIQPNYMKAHYNLGLALAGRGRFDEAIAHYRAALEIQPDYVDAYNNLGNAFADRGQIDDAITQYRKALDIKPDYMEAHYNLGNALAGRERSGEAIEHYQKALALATARDDRAKADIIRAQIKLYQSVAPARQAP